jgi:acylphosphatase
MHETQVARRYFVSGMVQGVGYRYFARQLAQRLGIAGYVKNLRDGRVEVYVIGPASVFASLRTELESGPNGASVAGVTEEEAPVDPVERDTRT